ncbi:hypothetical protein THMIRHAS_11860 [Thiosulfatimonas sediminis]|uniref:FMN-binding domain-containing protein n=1 Tax=Thiosulfatimonas sediminis TaxID=2675054 RepID=A0A6F8PUJ8_9GAMM|nr:FMN-binding protein [Thiosulfatimonas sediminis]BBP45813.1 hypothetical protein THMIRHAS_11860 [Thiosulfatimonas sediminis]
MFSPNFSKYNRHANASLALLAPLFVLSAPAYAEQYLSVAQAQQVLFTGASFEAHFLTLNEQQREQIKAISNVRQRWAEQQIWKAFEQDKFVGWFIIDKVIGKHEFITYATALNADGQVQGIEIMDYRESYGSEVRLAPWRAQFHGKQKVQNVKFNDTISNISGATLSCRNVTNGVKRLLAIHQLFLVTAV